MKNLFYITRSDMSSAPYPEVTLPALARAGWNLVVAGVNCTRSAYRAHLPYPCEAIDLPDPRSAFAHEKAIFGLLQRARFGKNQAIYINSQSMSWRAALALMGPTMGKSVIYHNPDYYCPIMYPRYTRLERRLCRKADLYINNEFHRGYITSVMYGTTCPVVTAPPNLPRSWPVPEASQEKRNWMSGGRADAFVIMVHGGYGQIRMTPELVEAFTLLPERFRLVMTGKGDQPDHVDARLAKLNLTERVLRLPKIDFQEMLSYSVNADAGVLLYQNSDLGNFFTAPGRLTEYLLCGLPLLGADHTGLENLVLRYQLGICADPTRPRAIADGILKLAEQKLRGEYPAERMRKLFYDHFAFDHWEPQIVESMEGVLKGVGRVPLSRPAFPWMPSP